MKNENKIKELFEKNSIAESYSLFDSNHPLDIYLGTNRYGQHSMLIISDSDRIEVVSSKFINVDYEKRTNRGLSLSFSLTKEDFSELFYRFCDDVIRNTLNANKNDGFLPVIKRYEAWQNLFKRENNHLSESEIKGLIGELIFVKECMIPKYGPEKTIEAYIGTEKAHKDFELGDIWYEVKAVHNGARSVSISSLEQLDSERTGYLNVITLDSGIPSNESISLNTLVQEVKEMLNGKALLAFEDKLLKYGYTDDQYYDSFNYLLISVISYKVSDSFPKLTKNMVPNGVLSAKYEIDLSVIEENKEPIWT